jgi:hypothetical protein
MIDEAPAPRRALLHVDQKKFLGLQRVLSGV